MESYVTSRGGKIWTNREGQGIPLLLCNGGPGCCDYLEPVAKMLEDRVQVIRFEQSGCGRSDSNPPYDIDACLCDMESIRRHYSIDRWVIGGHSWGADLALIYTLRYPERAIGFICISGGRFHNDRDWHRLYSERKEQGLEALPDFKYPPNLEVNRQGNLAWKEYIQRPSLWRELSELDRPGLMLYGEQDIRPSWPVEQVAALLPMARFSLIAGADHYLWFSHSDLMKGLLRDFVQSVSEPGSGNEENP
jgi:proline iminopeptidase